MITQPTQVAPAPAADGDQPPADQGKEAAIMAEVEKRVQEALTQQRSTNAGINGKPARTDATKPALSHRELFNQLYDKWYVQGEPIPKQYSEGLSK